MGEQLEFHWSASPVSGADTKSRACEPEVCQPPAASPEVLGELLARVSGEKIRLVFTDNRSTMLSYRRQPDGAVAVRAHRNFLAAPNEVWEAMAKWIRQPRARAAAKLVDQFIRENQPAPRPLAPDNRRLRTEGRHHQLQPHFDEVNRVHFTGKVTALITWGRASNRARQRNIRLGSYAPAENLIRIHPHLDQGFVPDFFVRYIIYHEMLHAHLGIEDSPSGRRCIHTRQFREMERQYPDYHRAEAWLGAPENLRRILKPGRHW
ncbi:MAG: hypothetical protein RLZZ303_1800 [Candidatus Hydrogenedentota bacterium]